MQHIVSAPDGTQHIIEAPDGATPDQIIAFAQQTIPQQQTPGDIPFEATKTGRLLHGVVDPAIGLDQLVPRGISEVTSLGGNFPNKVSNFYAEDAQKFDQIAKDRAQEYAAARAKDPSQVGPDGSLNFDAMRMAGNIVSPVNYIPGKIAAGVTSAILPKAAAGVAAAVPSLVQRLGSNAVTGALGMAAQPVENPQDGSFASQKLGQMAGGAVGGSLIGEGGNAVAGLIKPQVSGAAQMLLNAGVRLTPGQIVGGAAQAAENKATSIPLVGDSIKSAYQRGYEDFNRAVANRALSPIGQQLPDNIAVGHDAVGYVQKTLSDQYNKILPQMTGQIDQPLQQALGMIEQKTRLLPDDKAAQMQRILSDALDKKVQPDGSMTGPDVKEVMSTMMQNAASYGADSTADGRKMGWLFGEIKDAFSQMLQRNNPAELSQALSNTDEGYANFIRMQRAAASQNAAGKGGVFTPAQLLGAVKATDPSLRKGAFAKGEALMQDIAGAGQQVLPSKVPDSGTADRAMLGMAGLGGAGMVSPAAAAGGLGAAALYTRPGIFALGKLLAGNRYAASAPISNAVRAVTSPSTLANVLFK